MCQACQSIAEASSAPMLYAAGFAAAATAVWTKVRPGRGGAGEDEVGVEDQPVDDPVGADEPGATDVEDGAHLVGPSGRPLDHHR